MWVAATYPTLERGNAIAYHLICDGKNGRLVPVEDVAALAACMTDLLQREDLREKLGSGATKVRGVHSESRIMRLWHAAFQVPAHA